VTEPVADPPGAGAARLQRDSQRAFDPAQFHALRAARGGSFGAALHYQAETGSTNDDALAAARAGAPSGSVFLADHQTQGRGRRGKSWVAAPGHHLLFSILVRHGAAAPPPSALTLAVGLGVRAALAPASLARLGLKWPNDVLAEGRKLAGILCEGQFTGSSLSAVVIGIGINVLAAPYPPELASHVVCLEALAGDGARVPPREQLLVDVLAEVEARLDTCTSQGFAALFSDFAEHDALAGERVEVSGGAALAGIARGVDTEGRLLVESDGLLVPVLSGTVRVVERAR
jgi:BirA family biotin operon repressor/biotin-[acetyl-CoA-carboxylase] ligase